MLQSSSNAVYSTSTIEEYGAGDGVEAKPIGNDNIIYTTTSCSNISECSLNKGYELNALPPRIQPELRSPIVGKQKRTFGETSPMKPCFSEISDESDQESVAVETEKNSLSMGGDNIDQCLLQLKRGILVTFHDGSSVKGVQKVLRITEDHQHLCMSLGSPENFPESTERKIPLYPRNYEKSKAYVIENIGDKFMAVDDVCILYVGKKFSEILSSTQLHHVDRMLCFSIVSKGGAYFDFEAKTVLERETIVESIALFLNQAYHESTAEETIPIQQSSSCGTQSSSSLGTNNDSETSTEYYKRNSLVNNTRIHNSDHEEGTEATLDCNSHDVGSSRQLTTIPDNGYSYSDVSCADDEQAICASDSAAQWCLPFCSVDISEVFTNLISETYEVSRQQAVEICGENIGECSQDYIMSCFEQKVIEYNILHILGSSSKFTFGFIEGHVWSFQDVHAQWTPIEAQHVKKTSRNRATVLRAQVQRLMQLRNEQSFFNAIQTAITRNNNDTTNTANVNSHTSKHSLKRMNSFTKLEDSKISAGCDDDLFYDSDPEEYCRRVVTNSFNNIDLNEMSSKSHDKNKRARIYDKEIENRKDGDNHFKRTGNNERAEEKQIFRPSNEASITESINEITNNTLKLKWHTAQNGPQKNKCVICAVLWIELGSPIRNSYIQPKLMWREASEPLIEQRKLSISETQPHSVELLDICRILRAIYINREIYPFATKSSSFFIETSSSVFLFEAENEKERNRFVHGLKLLVSRLASQLIVGDLTVYHEFFTPGGKMASQWLENRNLGVYYTRN